MEFTKALEWLGNVHLIARHLRQHFKCDDYIRHHLAISIFKMSNAKFLTKQKVWPRKHFHFGSLPEPDIFFTRYSDVQEWGMLVYLKLDILSTLGKLPTWQIVCD